MTNEALKLVQSEQNNGLITCQYIYHGTFTIDNEKFYYLKIILHHISFVKVIIIGPKNQN